MNEPEQSSRFLRQFVGETRGGPGTPSADAAELAAAAGIGFGDIVVLDSAVPSVQPSGGAGVGAYRSPYRVEGDALIVLDQRRFPGGIVEVPCLSASDAAQAIRDGLAQGSGTVAAVGGYALALAAARRIRSGAASPRDELAAIEADAAALTAADPWNVALRRAIEAQLAFARQAVAGGAGVDSIAEGLRHEIDVMTMDEMLGLSRMVGPGVSLLREHAARRTDGSVPLRALVHGSVGALAFGQLGSAVASIHGAVGLGIPVYAWIDEGRPGMAGVRTAWELGHAGVGYWLIPDSAVGGILASSVDLVLTGAVGITRDGTALGEPGAYAIAALASRHDVPFYVCAPLSCLFFEGAAVQSPRYDAVPGDLVTGIVSEAGILRPPFEESLSAVISKRGEDRQNHFS